MTESELHMMTTCENCSCEVSVEEVGQCEACERDGLCPDCWPADAHDCEESDG